MMVFEWVHSRGVYDLTTRTDSRSEKPARGTLFSAMQRQMGQDTILIMDSLNYIKGFRYQMYCAAREIKIRVCTVSPIAPTFRVFLTLFSEVGLCRSQARAMPRMERRSRGRGHKVLGRNVRRKYHFPPGVLTIHRGRLDNLLRRYEEPSSMVRWDSPLFTVLWTDESPPNEDIWKAVTEGLMKPPNVGTQSVGQPVS